jgi:hypothetical protein
MAAGRPRRKAFVHRFKLSEVEGVNTRVMQLITNLEKLGQEYGESCVDSLIQRQLINMSFEQMVGEISGATQTIVLQKGVTPGEKLQQSSESLTEIEDEDDISSAFALDDSPS